MDTPLTQEIKIVEQVEQTLKQLGPFLTLAEAARSTGIPLPTLAEAVRLGRIPAVRVQPKRWLVRLQAVHIYFKDRLPKNKSAGKGNPFLDIASVAEGASESLADMPSDLASNLDHYLYGASKR